MISNDALAVEPPRGFRGLGKFAAWLGVDRAVVLGVLNQFWGFVSGPVTFLLLANNFSPNVQGYYYTFYSLLGLQIFVEMGLGQVIGQFACHEWARLEMDERGHIVGDAASLSRLTSLSRFAVRWYGVAAVGLSVVLAVGGGTFFARSPQVGVSWAAPWLILCLLQAVNLMLVPRWTLLEGCNQIPQVYRFRLGQGVLTSLVLWTAISTGAGLWTAALASATTLITSLGFLYYRYRGFFTSLAGDRPGPRVRWKEDIWPLQWRIALSWVSGYFSFALFTPTLFRYQGPAAAGRMGMTWTLINVLIGISSIWVATKGPRFGMLVARREYDELDRSVLKAGFASVGVCVTGALAIEAVLMLLASSLPRIAARLLSPAEAGVFLIATVLQVSVSTMAIYLRAHKREPLFGVSIAQALLTVASTVVLGRWYGPLGLGLGYLGTVAILTPVTTYIFLKCRAEWHDKPVL